MDLLEVILRHDHVEEQLNIHGLISVLFLNREWSVGLKASLEDLKEVFD